MLCHSAIENEEKIKPIRIDPRRLRAHPAVEMFLWGKQVWASAKGKFWNHYQLLASGRLPQCAFILKRSLWSSKFQEINKCCFCRILIESSSQEDAEVAVAGPLWGPEARAAWPSSETTTAPPALCTFVRPHTLHLPVMNTHVLHLLAFSVKSYQHHFVDCQAEPST